MRSHPQKVDISAIIKSGHLDSVIEVSAGIPSPLPFALINGDCATP